MGTCSEDGNTHMYIHMDLDLAQARLCRGSLCINRGYKVIKRGTNIILERCPQEGHSLFLFWRTHDYTNIDTEHIQKVVVSFPYKLNFN